MLSVRLLFATLFLFGCVSQSEPPLFHFEGKDYYRSDLPKDKQQEIFNLQLEYHKAMLAKVQAVVVEIYLKDRAKIENLTTEQAREKYIKGATPTEDEMRAFYEKEKGQLPYSYDIVKTEIRDWLLAKMQDDQQLNLLKTIEKEKAVKVYLEEPQAPVFTIPTAGFPAKGTDDSKVVLVEYADFTCPECFKATASVAAVLKRYGDQIRYVYKYFPRDNARIGEQAARAGHCANAQGKFWDYHDYAFANQHRLGWETSEDIAKQLKLNVQKFSACMNDPATAQIVQKSFNEGREFGVRGTPAFFINGHQIVKGFSQDVLGQEIEKAL
jgi:protein-disulfide isomerase